MNIKERKELDFSSFPNVIKVMIEENANAASIIDELIELKGERNSLAALILLDDMNIRGVQLDSLYQMCNQNIETFYKTVISITKDDINRLNQKTSPICIYKAVFKGTSKDRKMNPEKYIFTDEEREKHFKNKENNYTVEKDLYPSINIENALKIIENKGFICGYKKEYINNHNEKEVYRVFYNSLGDILYTTSLENKNIFLWKDAKLNVTLEDNQNYIIELKDHPFKTYKETSKNKHNRSKNNLTLPIIKTVKGMQYKEKYKTYDAHVTASIYDLLIFEQTYQHLDEGLKKIYKSLLENSSDKAYDEIINHLASDDGIQIATDLQNILGFSLSKSKLLAAKDRFYEAGGYKTKKEPKRFLSRLVSDEPYTKDMNNRIIDVLKHDIENI